MVSFVPQASSSRAAERLVSGAGALSFVGFDALSGAENGDVGYIPPASSAGDSAGVAIAHPDAAVLVTKLTKRDATTKYKALRSLGVLVEDDKDGKTVAEDILKHWPRIYKRLSLDVDRRVRVQTQIVHGVICKQVGKKLMGQLKFIVGPWLACQHDPSPDVASAAGNAFSTVFPTDEKRRKVYSICLGAIAEFCEDMMITQTIDSIADLQGVTLDAHEKQELYERAVSASVLALTSALAHVPDTKDINFISKIEAIITTSKLWKSISKSGSPLVKRAGYELVSSCARHTPQLLETILQRIVIFVFSGISDKDAFTVRASWNAALCVIKFLPSCWNAVDPRKTIWPHVWNMLKSGPSDVIFGSIGPFLGYVPDEVIGIGCAFHTALFSAMWEGMCNTRSKDSQEKLYTHLILSARTLAKRYCELIDRSCLCGDDPDAVDKAALSYCIGAEVAVRPLHHLSSLSEPLIKKLFWEKMVEYSGACVQQWKVLNAFPESKHGLNVDSVTEAEQDKNALYSWISTFISSTTRDHSGSYLATMVSDLTPRLIDKRIEPCIQLLSQILVCTLGIPVWSDHDKKQLTATVILETSMLPLLEAAQKASDTENIASEATCVKACLAMAHTAASGGASKAELSRIMWRITEMCLTVTGLAIFLTECDGNDILGDEWKTDSVKKACFKKALEVVKALPRERNEYQLLHIRILRQLLGTGVTKQYLSRRQHQELMVEFTASLKNMQEKVLPDSAAEVSLIFSSVAKQVDQESMDEVFALLAAFISACVYSASITANPANEAVKALYNQLSRYDNNNMVEALISGIENHLANLIHGDTQVFRQLDESTTISADAENLASVIAGVLQAVELSESCFAVSLPSSEHLRETRLKFFPPCSFECGYIVSKKLNITNGWLTGPQKLAGKTLAPSKHEMLTWGSKIIYAIAFISFMNSSFGSAANERRVSALVNELVLVHATLPSAKSKFDTVVGGRKLCMELDKQMHAFISVCAGLMTSDHICQQCCKTFVSMLEGIPCLDMNVASSAFVLASLLEDTALDEFYSMLLNSSKNNVVSRQVLQYLLTEGYTPRKMTMKIASLLSDDTVLTSSKLAEFMLKSSAISALYGTKEFQSPSDSEASFGVTERGTKSTLLAERATHRRTIVTASQGGSAVMTLVQPALKLLRNLDEAGEEALTVDTSTTDSLNTEDMLISLSVSIDAAKIFKLALLNGCFELTSEDWDFILCTTLTWLEAETTSLAEYALVASAASLAATLDSTFNAVELASSQGVGPKPDAPVLESMVEWRDFFVPAMGERIVHLILNASKTEESVAIQEDASHAAFLVSEDVSVGQAQIENVVQCFKSTSSKIVALACHHFLTKHIEASKNTDEAIEPEHVAGHICTLLADTAALSESNITICKMSLAALAFCSLFERATITGKASLATNIRPSKAVPTVLSLCAESIDFFKDLVPEAAKIFARSFGPSRLHMRNTQDGNGDMDNNILLCHTFFRVISSVPVISRDWFQDLGRRLSGEVIAFTSQYISPLIIEKELRTVLSNQEKDENLDISVRSKAREVVGVYSMEGMSMELVVAFDNAHPLQPVTVSCGRRVGVQTAQWRNWLLQMTTFMSNQNGSILDGYKIWKKNVDKRFEGLDECTICYAVIHPVNYTLPDKRCKTCKNAFHSACLYKWFNTSQQSTCPLCRNLWMN